VTARKTRWPSLDAVFITAVCVSRRSFFYTREQLAISCCRAPSPIFDSGLRTSLKVQRQAAVDAANASVAGGDLAINV